MSELLQIFNDSHVNTIMIGDGLSYFLTPTFNGIDNNKLKALL